MNDLEPFVGRPETVLAVAAILQALNSNHIEVELADCTWNWGVRVLQALEEHVIADTMGSEMETMSEERKTLHHCIEL